jgi:hypothetical protein
MEWVCTANIIELVQEMCVVVSQETKEANENRLHTTGHIKL